MRTWRIKTAGAPPRRETLHGREHLVVPVVAMVEGAIRAVNADGYEFVPASTIAHMAKSFDGRPVVLGHPSKGREMTTANTPEEIANRGFGTIFNSRAKGGRMGLEAWVDPARLIALGQPELLADLEAGRHVEISVGAEIRCAKSVGTDARGRAYESAWADGRGDHLAFLPGKKGACDGEMGCGANRAAGENEDFESTEEDFRALWEGAQVGKSTIFLFEGDKGKSIIDETTMRFAREVTQKERDAMDASDFAGPHESFPIKTQADVDAAAKLYGKADDPAAVKAKIITIAKRKGLTVPGAWVKRSAMSLRERLQKLAAAFRAAAPFDTPEQAASEEAAELVGYNALRTHLDAMGKTWDDASGIVDDLISDEEDDPTETPAQEEAEEEIETARLDALQGLLSMIISGAYAAQSTALKICEPDPPAMMSPRYMEASPECRAEWDRRAAVGKEISAKNMKTVQAMHDAAHAAHDSAVGLGAGCPSMKSAAAGADRDDHEGESDMDRKATIKALSECPCSGFTAADLKALEGMTDEQLARLKARSDATSDTETKLKVAEASVAAKDAELKAAQAQAIPAEELTQLRSLAAGEKARSETRKAELVGKLKAAQSAYSEEELKAMELGPLEKLAVLAKVEEKPSSFVGRQAAAGGGEKESFAPPDPWAAGIKAAQGTGKPN